MIIRFAKVQIKHNTNEQHFLHISIQSNRISYKLNTMRKIRNKVSNFYGQAIYLPLHAQSINIIIEQVSSDGEKKIIFNAIQEIQEQNRNKKCYGNIVSQNQMVKLYCSWQLQSSNSHYSSEFSRDIISIETPKKYYLEEQQGIFQQFSPKNNFQKSRIKIYLQEVKSQRLRSSITKNPSKQDSFKREKKIQTIQNPLSITKSVVTLSKTPTKIQQLKRSLPINKIDQKGNVLYNRQKALNKTTNQQKLKENSKIQNFRRRNSLNVNKVGATIASTLGFFAGIIAGMAASSY